MSFKNILFAIASMIFSQTVWTQSEVVSQINVGTLKKDVYYLASEELAGRGSGQPGGDLAAAYIKERFEQLGLKPMGMDATYFHPFQFTYGGNPHGQSDENTIEGTGINVAAYLDNGASSTIVIGGHYDHLGKGEFGNIRDPKQIGVAHVGADDNASGTAGVLALAEYFSKNERTEAFNFLFICFSGEELGLIGSKRYVEDNLYPIDELNYMINLDMIGRLDPEKRTLHIHGVGTSDVWVPMIDGMNSNFQIVKDSSGTGPSDFTSFYLAKVPVLHFYTGAHSDYHTPNDTPDKINYEGQKEVLQKIIAIIEATEDIGKIGFQETKSVQSGTSRFKVTLGVMPDYAWQEAGLKLDGVSEGRPADMAGIKGGDIILSIGDIKIETIQDYMSILGKHDKGDNVTAIVKRGDETLQLQITF